MTKLAALTYEQMAALVIALKGRRPDIINIIVEEMYLNLRRGGA